MDDSDTTRRRFIVRGLVQGVGFRYWTTRQAQRLSLRGSVRNLEDGSVEVEVLGPAPNVEQFRQLLLRGPAHAQVREVRDEPPGTQPLPDHFDVAF